MLRIVLFVVITMGASTLNAGEWSGRLAAESRLFQNDGFDARQDEKNYSISFLPEYYTDWNDGNDSLTFEPFLRIDSDDHERTHADIRELIWVHVGDGWELHLGIGKVFWGVTESRHLVDIVNQTDLIENIDGEDKLGQPMAHMSLVREWGTLDIFALPYFRERTFPGKSGRLRSIPYVDADRPVYESGDNERHLDWALRWSRTIDIWDIGISHFSGTSRDPRLVPALDGTGRPVLIPFYGQIQQTGLDLQATKDDWLYKLEWVVRRGQKDKYRALTAGFEYTLVGINESSHDLGLLAEYLYDSRGANTPDFFEDDLFLGTRWKWNDTQDTELLAGVILDTDSSERLLRMEASRRIGANMKLNIEAQIFSNISPTSPLSTYNREDFVQIELAWYF